MMKTLTNENLEKISGGGFFASVLAGAACGLALAAVVPSGGLSAPIAYVGCAAALAAVLDV
jgi:bacteriocin-like protein